MEYEVFNSTWTECVKFKEDNKSQIKDIWVEILSKMPIKIKSNLPEDLPILEIYAKKEAISSSIPYVFKIPNICSCNGINEFLEKYIIYIHWQ